MTKISSSTVKTAANVNLTAEQLQAELAKWDTKGMSDRKVNQFAREHVVAEFAPAAGVEELPEVGFRGERSTAAYSGVAGGKDVPVFMGRRKVIAAGVLHADGSLTVDGETHGSPSRAAGEARRARGLKGIRKSGWTQWLYVDAEGAVRPIEALREGGVEQRRSKTATVRKVETAKRVKELKAFARKVAKGA